MCDALQELSDLTLDLQVQNIDLYKADREIKNTVQIFEERIENSGQYYSVALESQKIIKFKGIELHKNEKHGPAINSPALYDSFKESVKKRLLDGNDAGLPECAKVLDSEYWPENPGNKLTFGKTEIRKLVKRKHCVISVNIYKKIKFQMHYFP
mgnify:CR=1 FL=1